MTKQKIEIEINVPNGFAVDEDKRYIIEQNSEHFAIYGWFKKSFEENELLRNCLHCKHSLGDQCINEKDWCGNDESKPFYEQKMEESEE